MKFAIKYIALFIFILFSICVFANKLEKAYRDLSIYNYFSAKHRFEKLLKRKNSAASFGLSNIFYRNDNPFHNLDSAFTYIIKSKEAYEILKEKEKIKLKTLHIDSASIDSLFHLICQKKFKLVADSADVEFYNQFIVLFKSAPQLTDAINKRNELAFLNAKKSNSSDALCRFTETYPDASQVHEALQLYEKLLFAEETKSETLSEYVKFLENYPDNKNRIIAEEKIFMLSTKDGKLKSYLDFIIKYPKNQNVNTAWRNVYLLYTKEFSKEKIMDFIKIYPNYPFMNELNEDIKLSVISFYPIKKNNLWGFINEEGEVLIEPAYQWTSNFKEGFAIIQLNHKKGFINKRGENVIPPVFDDAENFNKGFAVVIRDDFYGLIDKTGKIVVPVKYNYLGELSDSLLLAEKDGKYGYLDEKGNTAIPFIYDAAGDFKNKFAYVKITEKMGIINQNGINVLRCEYDWIENFNNGIARVKKEDKFGILNSNADTILPIEYSYIGSFKNGLALIAQNNKYGYVNSNGKITIPIEFVFDNTTKEWADFNNGLAVFKQKNKFGLIDSTAKKIIEAKYDVIGNVGKNKWVPVLQKDKWIYLSLSKKQAPTGKFDYATPFNEQGFAIVKQKDLFYLINEKVEFITQSGFEKIELRQGFIQVLLNNKYGILSQNMEELAPIEYEQLEWIDNFIVKAKKENFIFYINLKNKKNIHTSEQ
jgi:hypothetical protein